MSMSWKFKKFEGYLANIEHIFVNSPEIRKAHP